MKNVAICDDEKHFRDKVKGLVEPFATKYGFQIFEFDKGEDLVETVQNGEVIDFIFLDIEMDELNGVETARALRRLRCRARIFFLTSNPGYVVDAFELGAFQYMLKPVEKEKFEKQFQRAINIKLRSESKYEISWRGETNYLEVGEILYVSQYKRKIMFVAENEEYQTSKKFIDIERELEPHGFVKCHIGYIVNMRFIKTIKKNSLILINDDELPISRQMKHNVVMKFNLFVSESCV